MLSEEKWGFSYGEETIKSIFHYDSTLNPVTCLTSKCPTCSMSSEHNDWEENVLWIQIARKKKKQCFYLCDKTPSPITA